MQISGLEGEFWLAAGKPMLPNLKRPVPGQEPRLTAMIDGIRGSARCRAGPSPPPGELERLLADGSVE